MTRNTALLLSVLLAAAPALGATKQHAHALPPIGEVPARKPISEKPVSEKPVSRKAADQKVNAPIAPSPRPVPQVAQTPEPVMDLSKALPGKALASLPPSAQQLKSLSSELKKKTPELASAKEKSDQLAAEAASLRQKLIATAARIEVLEKQQVDTDAHIVQLTAEDNRLSAGFANDRVAVTRLLGVLERLQHDMPPALAMRPDDALAAARGSMLIGASLPPVYAQAASLSRRIDALKHTRQALEQQQAQAADTTARLTIARRDLDELLTQKEKEAEGAAETYGNLKTRLEQVARQAADFQALLARVKALRQQGGSEPAVVTVMAENSCSPGGLAKNSLLAPVVGSMVGTSDAANPGLSYATRPGAQVITPADGKALYAGPYHKNGQVLILEITTGYDAVLAGLGRVTVKPNDQLLAGEPVGNMPADAADDRLYFELRHGGHGQSPAPWLKLNLRTSFGKANGT
ncbi:MAG TPA: peptidoglycan DD-metalloendopeptidase family protein [Rhizomicrobium sp.]|nr:peptidoglycan DD-metalloendopeptidase family protein [Rhizomicrobium sp.]